MTLTWTTPLPPGDIAVIVVPPLEILTFEPGVVPKNTEESLEKPLPYIVTLVPPLAGPWVGEILLTTGV